MAKPAWFWPQGPHLGLHGFQTIGFHLLLLSVHSSDPSAVLSPQQYREICGDALLQGARWEDGSRCVGFMSGPVNGFGENKSINVKDSGIDVLRWIDSFLRNSINWVWNGPSDWAAWSLTCNPLTCQFFFLRQKKDWTIINRWHGVLKPSQWAHHIPLCVGVGMESRVSRI